MADITNPRQNNRLFRLLAQRYTTPFRHSLPSLVDEMLARESRLQRLSKNLKLLKNWLWLKWNGQSHRLHDRLPPAPRKLLWLHYSSNSIGDSINELAGRTLLSGYQVDLLTNKTYAELYKDDPFLGTVFSNPSHIDISQYDFVLLDIFNTRSIRLKRQLCPELPYACIQGFFYGANFNRMLFSYYRIHHLLGYPHHDKDLAGFLHPKLFFRDDPSPLPPKRKLKRIALMLGGKKHIKIYRQWPEVIGCLHERWPSGREFPEFVLIGSQNGLELVAPVIEALDRAQAAYTSCVSSLTLRQTGRALADCDFFLGTDGALMHVANALAVPGVTIFGKVLPKFYTPPQSDMQTIYHPITVDQVAPVDVAETILKHPWMSGQEHLITTQ